MTGLGQTPCVALVTVTGGKVGADGKPRAAEATKIFQEQLARESRERPVAHVNYPAVETECFAASFLLSTTW